MSSRPFGCQAMHNMGIFFFSWTSSSRSNDKGVTGNIAQEQLPSMNDSDQIFRKLPQVFTAKFR